MAMHPVSKADPVFRIGREILMRDLEGIVDDGHADAGAPGAVPGLDRPQILAGRAGEASVIGQMPLAGQQRVDAGGLGRRRAAIAQ